MAQPNNAELRAEILERFTSHIPPDAETVLSECVKCCQIFNVSPDELFFKWEAIAMDLKPTHSSIHRIVDMESLAAVKANMQRSVPKQQKKSTGQPATLAGVMSRRAINGFSGSGAPRRFPDQSASGFPSPHRAAQIKRELDETKSLIPSGSRVQITRPERENETYRYMYEKPSERSDVLDDRIDDFAEIVRQHYDINELGDPSAATEEDVVVVGRIVADSDAPSSTKLNYGSVTIESSRMMGSGSRVPLRFEPDLKIRRGRNGVGLFPGAIVALKGRNGGGGWFSVSEVLSIPPLKPPSQLAKSESGTSFTMCIACGPYTLDSDLSYQPWREFMLSVEKDRPDVVLLMGPFIDSSHSHIRSGEISHTPNDMFRSHFEQPLNNLLARSPSTTVLVVPSVQDILSDHAVFPQPRMNPSLLADYRIHFLPNPCKFSLNGVSFAVSTVDVLFHLRKEEFLKRGEQVEPVQSPSNGAGDAMVDLCRHLLQQRSMYPIFPVPSDNSQEVNLNVSHSELLDLEGESEDHSPHVMILPSRLKYFSKMLDGTTAINPSFLSKGVFAHFAYHQSGGAKDGIKVEIRKLNDVRSG